MPRFAAAFPLIRATSSLVVLRAGRTTPRSEPHCKPQIQPQPNEFPSPCRGAHSGQPALPQRPKPAPMRHEAGTPWGCRTSCALSAHAPLGRNSRQNPESVRQSPRPPASLIAHVARHAPDTGNSARVAHHPRQLLLVLRDPHHVHNAVHRPVDIVNVRGIEVEHQSQRKLSRGPRVPRASRDPRHLAYLQLVDHLAHPASTSGELDRACLGFRARNHAREQNAAFDDRKGHGSVEIGIVIEARSGSARSGSSGRRPPRRWNAPPP